MNSWLTMNDLEGFQNGNERRKMHQNTPCHSSANESKYIAEVRDGVVVHEMTNENLISRL